ncbi:MAG: TniB family NTP-binding protein [Candidatus Methylopumilus sp.]|jgi:hypothetical protein
MSNLYPHLSELAIEALSFPIDDRISYIKKDRWIPYTAAKAILEVLEDLLRKPDTIRTPGRIIIARSNNGKSSLINKFLSSHKPSDNMQGNHIKVPVLLVDAPHKPDLLRFYHSILDGLYIPFNLKHGERQIQRQLFETLNNIELGMIAIDEANNLLAGSALNQRAFLNLLKSMSNETNIPIVLLGTPEAQYAIETNQALASRFPPSALPRWQCDNEFRQLLASFEKVIPLKKPSNLQDKAFAEFIYQTAGDCIGDITTFIQTAAIYAIRNNIECIDINVVRKCGHLSPAASRLAFKNV